MSAEKAHTHNSERGMTPWRIVGFACYQSFIYAGFYSSGGSAISLDGNDYYRLDLLATLICMALGFTFINIAPIVSRALDASTWSVPCCAVMMLVGVAFAQVVSETTALSLIAYGVLTGIPLALLLRWWGAEFGKDSPNQAAADVMIASGLAAGLCFVAGCVDALGSVVVQCAVTALSAGVLMRLQDRSASSNRVCDARALSRVETGPHHEWRLAMGGTMMYGFAAGIMEIYVFLTYSTGMRVLNTALFILLLFCIAAYQSLTWKDDSSTASLAFLYKTVVMIVVAGFFLTPILEGVSDLGETVVLGGFLGLQTTLAGAFIAISSKTATPVQDGFTRGFFALFAGEAIGILFGNATQYAPMLTAFGPGELVAIGGIAMLFAYLYLFTNNSFAQYSEAVTPQDGKERAAYAMAREYRLSPRETEVIELALRGWTNERISQELYVSKSTVDTHLRRIYGKLGIHTRQELYDLAGRGR